MALKQLWYFLDLSPKIICYYNMFQQKQQPLSTIASERRGTSMQVHFVSCFLFILNLTIYMIIYKRNIHVWRSMKHFQNANLQKGLQKLTFKYNDKLEYVFLYRCSLLWFSSCRVSDLASNSPQPMTMTQRDAVLGRPSGNTVPT